MLTPAHQVFVKQIDQNVKEMHYGQMTITVIVKDGVPMPKTMTAVLMRRRKYKLPTSA